MPEQNNGNTQTKQIMNESNAVKMDSNEAYEYFSDKEEAEKHKTETEKPRIL